MYKFIYDVYTYIFLYDIHMICTIFTHWRLGSNHGHPYRKCHSRIFLSRRCVPPFLRRSCSWGGVEMATWRLWGKKVRTWRTIMNHLSMNISYIYIYTPYLYISYTWGTSNRELEYITDRTEPSNRKIEMTHPIFIDNLVNMNHSWIWLDCVSP